MQKAVDASRPETATQITDSRHAVKDVSESQNEYCDTTAQADIVLGRFHLRMQLSIDETAPVLIEAVDQGRHGPKIWVPRGESGGTYVMPMY